MKTVGVVLAGCGFLDGAEIYESVLTLLHLDRLGVSYQCLAPDIPQMHVVNHATAQPTEESRSVFVEAARIARGNIKQLSLDWVRKLDAVIFPGGFGAAKNFCNYATKGDACEIHPLVEEFMTAAIEAGKPVGVICISPVVLARALQGKGIHVRLTVGADSLASKSVEKFGAIHAECPVIDCIVDDFNHVVSTPAYMYSSRISEVEQGVAKLVREVVRMMSESEALHQSVAVTRC